MNIHVTGLLQVISTYNAIKQELQAIANVQPDVIDMMTALCQLHHLNMSDAEIEECATSCLHVASGTMVIEVEALVAAPAFKAAIRARAHQIKSGIESLLRLGALDKWKASMPLAASSALDKRPRQWEGKELVECIDDVYDLVRSFSSCVQ